VPYLPPGLKTIDCISINPRYVEGYTLIGQIKDKDGNVLATYTYEQVADTTIFCAEIETPSQEGIYAIDYRIVDAEGNTVNNLYDRYLVVSEKISTLAVASKTLEVVEGQVVPDVNEIKANVNKIVPWVQTRKA